MKIKRRFPNSFSGFEEDVTEHEVNSLEELLNIKWISEYKENPKFIGMYYSPADYGGTDALMALFEGERTAYFVVGYIFGDGKKLGLKNYLDYIK